MVFLGCDTLEHHLRRYLVQARRAIGALAILRVFMAMPTLSSLYPSDYFLKPSTNRRQP